MLTLSLSLSLSLKFQLIALSGGQFTVCMVVQQPGYLRLQFRPYHLRICKKVFIILAQAKAVSISVDRLVGPEAPGKTCHIVINNDGSYGNFSSMSCLHIS